jgi:hypothetical protein
MIEAPKKQEKRPSFFARIFGRKSRTRTLAGALAATIGGQELSRGAEFSHKTEPPPGFEEMVKYPDDVVAQYKTVFGEDPPEKVSAVDLAWRIHTLASTMEGSGSGTESPRNLVSVKSLAPRRTQRPRDIRPKELRESTSLNSEEGPATDLKTGQSEVFGKAPITPVEVKSLARVPKRPEAKNVPPALSRDEVAETRALNTAELERVRRVVAEHTARIAQTNTPISVSALKTETKPRNIEGTMREVVKESMPYGSSPKAFHNKNKLFIDPDQPRLFKDMKGQLVAYGGNFDKRSERAIKRITEDPTAKVQILVDEQVERPYVGEYVFDSATQRPKVVPLSMKDLKPSFWSRIGSIFKKRPKIDPDMFVQEVA